MNKQNNLSGIELYFLQKIDNDFFKISGDEFKHAVKVMRHKLEDEIYASDGKGKIFKGKIVEISADTITSKIQDEYSFFNKLSKIIFCVPKLKSPDRFEFALEKCVELGITRFIIFDAARGISKRDKVERWSKILLSSMKQSLRSFLPEVQTASLKEISARPGVKYYFDQNAERKLSDLKIDSQKNHYFIFGPEGGLADEEFALFERSNSLQLTDNRLRSETAITSAAALLSIK